MLLTHLYSAMWSNMWAPSMWTLFGIGLSHVHLKRHVDKKHAELHAHVDHVHDQLHKKIDGIK